MAVRISITSTYPIGGQCFLVVPTAAALSDVDKGHSFPTLYILPV